MRPPTIALYAFLTLTSTFDTSADGRLIRASNVFGPSPNCISGTCSVLIDRLARTESSEPEHAEQPTHPHVERNFRHRFFRRDRLTHDRLLRRSPRHANLEAREEASPGELRPLLKIGRRRRTELENTEPPTRTDETGQVPKAPSGLEDTHRTVFPFRTEERPTVEVRREPEPLAR